VRLEEDFSEFIEFIGQDASEEMLNLLMKAHEFFNKKSLLRDNENMY
jgi:hypothetical protein